MGCNCPGAPNGYTNSVYSKEEPTYRQEKECAEQYMKRAEGDPIAGPPIADKIENTTLTFDCDWKINVQMKMTDGSRTPDRWVMEPSTDWMYDENGVALPAMNTFTSTGKIDGYVKPSKSPKVYNVTIKAYLGSELLDSKPYTVVAQECGADDSITLIHPLPGSVVTSKCSGERKHPVTGVPRPHKGTDFAYGGGKVGDVICVADGTVIYAGTMSGYGNIVIVEHKSKAGKVLCKTRSAHLDKIYVGVGAKVNAGQPLGLEGNTGIGTGKHLHFELRGPDDAVWDPEPFVVGKQPWGSDAKPFAGAPAPSGGGTTPPTKPARQATTAVTAAKADNPCQPSTPTDTQTAPETPTPPPPAPVPGECWEKAFDFTMKSEIGTWYNPSDPQTVGGCKDCDAKTAKKKCGQITDTGGLTKFGCAAKYNGQSTVQELDLAGAKSIFKSKYYEPALCGKMTTNGQPSCVKACLAASAYYHQGAGGYNNILRHLTGATGSGALNKINAMSDAEFIEKFSASRLEALRQSTNWMKYQTAFTNRVNNEKSWAKTISV